MSTTQEDCNLCPVGKFNEINGSDSINDCKACPTGTKSSVGSTVCTSCSIGFYSDSMSVEVCKKCPIGKFTNKEGSISCENCISNSESNRENTNCECIIGTYNYSNNCIECPERFNCDKGSYFFIAEL